ncbi:MAG: hypothetical protein OXC30_03955 [Alphaproteobacteria bacterium]|nr:hypothetical protein [Alphaproteobacteria bacterium]
MNYMFLLFLSIQLFSAVCTAADDCDLDCPLWDLKKVKKYSTTFDELDKTLNDSACMQKHPRDPMQLAMRLFDHDSKNEFGFALSKLFGNMVDELRLLIAKAPEANMTVDDQILDMNRLLYLIAFNGHDSEGPVIPEHIEFYELHDHTLALKCTWHLKNHSISSVEKVQHQLDQTFRYYLSQCEAAASYGFQPQS